MALQPTHCPFKAVVGLLVNSVSRHPPPYQASPSPGWGGPRGPATRRSRPPLWARPGRAPPWTPRRARGAYSASTTKPPVEAAVRLRPAICSRLAARDSPPWITLQVSGGGFMLLLRASGSRGQGGGVRRMRRERGGTCGLGDSSAQIGGENHLNPRHVLQLDSLNVLNCWRVNPGTSPWGFCSSSSRRPCSRQQGAAFPIAGALCCSSGPS